MKCSYPHCGKDVEGQFEEILEQGYGFCERGHRTELPGNTQADWRCDCGARTTKQPAHSYYCKENKRSGI